MDIAAEYFSDSMNTRNIRLLHKAAASVHINFSFLRP